MRGKQKEPTRGWAMVLTRELTAEGLIEALEAGRFYASSGVALQRVETSAESLLVEVEPVPGVDYKIEFVGTRTSADLAGEPVVDDEGKPVRASRRYSNQIGEVLAAVDGPRSEYRFRGDELNVRARVTASQPHPNPSEPGDKTMAWTQPVVVAEVRAAGNFE